MDKRLVMLDRDGVLNVDMGYVHTSDQWQWVDGAPEAVAYLVKSGYTIVVVTNQSGIARGIYTEHEMKILHQWVNQQLHAQGGEISRFYYCPHLPNAPLKEYDCVCNCRKPKPGMIQHALRDAGRLPAEALLIGDRRRDLVAAMRAGVDSYLFSGGNLYDFIRRLGIGENNYETNVF